MQAKSNLIVLTKPADLITQANLEELARLRAECRLAIERFDTARDRIEASLHRGAVIEPGLHFVRLEPVSAVRLLLDEKVC